MDQHIIRATLGASIAVLALSAAPPARACTMVVPANQAFASPFIVEAQVIALDEGVATLRLRDVLRPVDEPPSETPLRVDLHMEAYDLGCRPSLYDPVPIGVGERAFLMLVPSTPGWQTDWRPAGTYGTGVRTIRGGKIYELQGGDWIHETSVRRFRRWVQHGPDAVTSWERRRLEERVQRSCRRGHEPEACLDLVGYLGGRAPRRSAAAIRRACRLGLREGCIAHGLLLLGSPQDGDHEPIPSEVVDLVAELDRRCGASEPQACEARRGALEAAGWVP